MTKEHEKLIIKLMQHSIHIPYAGKTTKGKFVFTDGYIIYEEDEDLGYGRINGDKYVAFMDAIEDKIIMGPEELNAIQCPDLKLVREYIKEDVKRYDFGDGLPMFDIVKLRDVLRFVGSDAMMYCYNVRFGALFKGSKGRAFLMPIRKPDTDPLEGMEKYENK